MKLHSGDMIMKTVNMKYCIFYLRGDEKLNSTYITRGREDGLRAFRVFDLTDAMDTFLFITVFRELSSLLLSILKRYILLKRRLRKRAEIPLDRQVSTRIFFI